MRAVQPNREPELRELLAPLEAPVEIDDAPNEMARRRTLNAMAEAALQAAEPRRVPWWQAVAVAAALVLAVGGAWLVTSTASNGKVASNVEMLSVQGEVQVGGVSGQQALNTDQWPASGELVTRDDGAARLRLQGGTLLDVGANSRVPLADLNSTAASKAVRLRSGSVRCQVPALARERSFSVVTRDAQVVVHGTEFTVAVAPAPEGEVTRVDVESGVVMVHYDGGQARLTDGMSWSSGSETQRPPSQARAAARQNAVSVDELPPSEQPSSVGSEESAPRAPEPPEEEETGTLDAERALLHQALANERQERLEAAAKLYRQLLQDYPDSTLAPEARAGLSRVGHAAGR